MHKRTWLATATLTALLLTAGSLQVAPTGVEAELAPHALGMQTLQSAEAPVGPQWGYAWGMEGEDAAAFGALGVFTCAPFIWIGAIACGLTGVA